MSTYSSEIIWRRDAQVFTNNKYSRRHTWSFDGGVEVIASSSPQVVPLPWSDEHAVDPEEAFVASLASCHMLWFLSIAAKSGFVVDEYRDCPLGTMKKNSLGKLMIADVVLRPRVQFTGEHRPADAEVQDMHAKAHEECFIANSVKTDVRCEPVLP